MLRVRGRRLRSWTCLEVTGEEGGGIVGYLYVCMYGVGLRYGSVGALIIEVFRLVRLRSRHFPGYVSEYRYAVWRLDFVRLVYLL